MYGDLADIVCSKVSAYDVGVLLGLDPDIGGRCACPVHRGRDRNMFLQKDGPWAHCYVCGSNMNVINLTRSVQHTTFKQAVEWLNSAFHLGLNIDQSHDKNATEAIRIAKEKRLREQAEKHMAEMEKYEAFLDADQLLNWAEGVVERFAPTVPGQEWDWRFGVVLNALTELREDREMLRLMCWKAK